MSIEVLKGAQAEKRIIGIAELVVSRDSEDLLSTYALGIWLAVSVHTPVAAAGGALVRRRPP